MWGLIKVVLLFLLPTRAHLLICSRYPSHTFTPKSPVDENFVISVQGNPQTYILGQEYNISLNAYNGLRYISFSLVLENDEGDTTYHEDLGHFEVTDPIDTRYSPNCVNMIESTNTNPKSRIDVSWIAPHEPGSGCILIRATVLQHRDVWYMDDGGLTKKICEEIVDDVESKNILQSTKPCCACDEARYEMIFEGIWSRNLHPKDFPTKGWTARFSDLIGAAHSGDYRFWEYGALASPAMREFGEHGSSNTLENEFNMNFRNGQIRTIIKARGPAFPNLNGQTVASVRVDPHHHLVSIASKIIPSPDWIVGVSGLELCHANCTWLASKVINLYPWDLGTDAGPSYTSPNQPQVPADVIRRMRSDFPNDPRSPFFDETGAPMKPLASLTIKRQRLYERTCADDDSNNYGVSRECFTHPWTAWSECTARCGEGKQYRTRVYKQPEVAKIYDCDNVVRRREDRVCTGALCGAYDDPMGRNQIQNQYPPQESEFLNPEMDQGYSRFSTPECELSSWSPWSICNATCGEGKKIRTRQYLNSFNEAKCQSARFYHLVEYKPCSGQKCLGDISNQDPNYSYMDETNSYLPDRENSDNFYSRRTSVPRRPYEDQNSGDVYRGYENPNENNEMIGENLETLDPGFSRNPNENRFQNPRYNSKQFSDSRSEQTSSGSRYRAKPKDNYNYDLDPEKPRNEEYEYQGKKPYNSRNEDYSYGRQAFGPMTPDNTQENQNFPRPGSNYEQGTDSYPNIDQQGDNRVPSYCYEQLQIFNCLDPTVVGNFWFYNFCEDECMLYAADTCDKNDNKFSSLEMCELRCKQPTSESFLQQLQLDQCPNKRQGLRLRSGKRKWRRRN